jgi:hypothetical protein
LEIVYALWTDVVGSFRHRRHENVEKKNNVFGWASRPIISKIAYGITESVRKRGTDNYFQLLKLGVEEEERMLKNNKYWCCCTNLIAPDEERFAFVLGPTSSHL